MTTDGPGQEALLGADFAHRVIERVRKAKRRRRLYRWAAASATAFTLAVWAIVWMAPLGSQPKVPDFIGAANHAARGAFVEPAWPSSAESASFDRPLAFFFPGAIAAADIQSSEATYWHAYDSWWNPNP